MKGITLAVVLLALAPAAADAKSFAVLLSGSARKDVAISHPYTNPDDSYCEGSATTSENGFVLANMAARPFPRGSSFSRGILDFVTRLSGHKAEYTSRVDGGFTKKPDAPSYVRDDACDIGNRGPFVQKCHQFTGDALSRSGSPFRLRSVRGKMAIQYFSDSDEFAINCSADQLGGSWMSSPVPTKLALATMNGMPKGGTAIRQGVATLKSGSGQTNLSVITTLKYTLKVHRVS